MPDTSTDHLRRPTASRPFRLALASMLLVILAHVAPTRAADCIQPKPNATAGATFRTTPATSGTPLGKLSPGTRAPLIATVGRWYETTTASGQTAFISKQSTAIVPCAEVPAPAPASASAVGGTFELHAIDVGTGLALLIRGPDFTLAEDFGSNDDLAIGIGNRAIAYLRTLSPPVTKLQHLILTHPHRDHVELMPDVISQVEVEQFWNSGAYNDICAYRHVLEAIAANPAIQYHSATQGEGDESVALGKKVCYGSNEPPHTITLHHATRIEDQVVILGQGASMKFLYADGSPHASFNENSLVVRLDLGSHKILLMGDAEAGGRNSPMTAPSSNSIEGKLLACCAADLKADVLVVGHHGSKTSSRTAFLDAVGAKFFIVSSGPTKYATVTLPDDEVITQLEARGELFRTDLDDVQCVQSESKIGPDSDGKPGGCDNILVKLPSVGPITAEYHQVGD